MTLEHYTGFRKPSIYLLSNFSFICFFVFHLTMSVFASQKRLLSSTKVSLLLSLLSCIHKKMLKTAFSLMLHLSGCNELFLNSESSLGVKSSLQKKQLSNTHGLDIAKCTLSHTDLTVKCLSPFVTMIMELGNNKHHFFTLFSKTLTCAQSCLPH